jgi:amino acid transporter/nucleotide-binding universal stress UspA family protein
MDDSASADAANAQGHEIREEGDRSMGFPTAAAIGVGTMIAAGIFVLSGLAVSKVGTAAIVSFLIAAVVASLTAAAYAEFASIYPESGGGYVYVARTIPSELTYLMGWTMILGYPASAAFYLGSFSKWFHEFLYGPLNIPAAIPFWLTGLGILALLVGLNLAGAEEAGVFQIVVTGLKVLLIAVFLFGALQAFDASVVLSSFERNVGDFVSVGVTSALVFITFFGFSAIATDAEEIKNPASTIPKAIYFSMAFVSIVYTLVVLAIVVAVNDQTGFLPFLREQVDLGALGPAEYVAEHGELAMGLAAEFYLGEIGFFLIVAGALISMLSAANATILAGSRVKLALARNGHLPRSFAALHDEWGTPYRAVLLTGTFILTLIVAFTVLFPSGSSPAAGLVPVGPALGLEGLANFANFLLIIGLSVVNVALILSRRRFPDVERGFEVPFVPVVPIVALLGNAVLLANIAYRNPEIAVVGLLAEVVGVAVWFLIRDWDTDEGFLEDRTPTVVDEGASTKDHGYQLVVPVANGANVEDLVGSAADVVAGRDAEILVLNVATVPPQTPYSEADEQVAAGRQLVERGMDVAEASGVPVSGTVRVAHDPENAIVNTVDQYDSDGVLMGWGGDLSDRRNVAVGTTVDAVAEESDADVFVQNTGSRATDGDVDSILLPWTSGTHSELAAELATTLAETNDASVEVVRVVDGSAEDRGRAEEMVENIRSRLAEEGVDVTARVIEADDVTEALVAASEDHDVTALGAATEGVLQRLVFGPVPERIGDDADGTVVMCQREPDAPSRLKRWLASLG